MEIVYKRKQLELDIRKILADNNIEAQLELREQSFAEYKGPPLFGSVWPAFDLGQYIINFVFSKEMVDAVVFGTFVEAIKAAFHLLKEKQASENDRLAILTDRSYQGIHKNIAFIFYARQPEEEVQKALAELPEARRKLLEFLNSVTTTHSTIELEYLAYLGQWAIKNHTPQSERESRYLLLRKRFFAASVIFLVGLLIGHYII